MDREFKKSINKKVYFVMKVKEEIGKGEVGKEGWGKEGY